MKKERDIPNIFIFLFTCGVFLQFRISAFKIESYLVTVDVCCSCHVLMHLFVAIPYSQSLGLGPLVYIIYHSS